MSALSVVKGKLSSADEIRSSSAEFLTKILWKEEELLEVAGCEGPTSCGRGSS
jgi:hypothetical protein